jgi:hypothetical protein
MIFRDLENRLPFLGKQLPGPAAIPATSFQPAPCVNIGKMGFLLQAKTGFLRLELIEVHPLRTGLKQGDIQHFT